MVEDYLILGKDFKKNYFFKKNMEKFTSVPSQCCIKQLFTMPHVKTWVAYNFDGEQGAGKIMIIDDFLIPCVFEEYSSTVITGVSKFVQRFNWKVSIITITFHNVRIYKHVCIYCGVISRNWTKWSSNWFLDVGVKNILSRI